LDEMKHIKVKNSKRERERKVEIERKIGNRKDKKKIE